MISSRKLSPRKLKANRASTGPRTAAGKACAACNARKHGLSVSVVSDPSLVAEVTILAQQIAGEGANKHLQQLAARIAEAQIDLFRIRSARRKLLSLTRIDLEPVIPTDWELRLTRHWGYNKPVL